MGVNSRVGILNPLQRVSRECLRLVHEDYRIRHRRLLSRSHLKTLLVDAKTVQPIL